MLDILFMFNINVNKTYILFAIVELAWNILACFGKAPESNCTFYEFVIYRNVQYHDDSRQKNIIMHADKKQHE